FIRFLHVCPRSLSLSLYLHFHSRPNPSAMNYYNITFRRLLIGTTLISGLSGALGAQEVPIPFSKTRLTRTFNAHDYQGGIQNWGIVQDRRGLIYVANNFSLLEYDGQHWKRNDVENNTRVRSVFV